MSHKNFCKFKLYDTHRQKFTGLINVSTGIPLNITYAGCRVCLWNDNTATNWYRFGMNGITLFKIAQ